MRPLPVQRILASAACAAVLLALGCGGGGGGGNPSNDAAPVAVAVSERTSGLALPWGLAFLPDGRILVTERVGSLKLLAADGTLLGDIGGVPQVLLAGQGGLLDVVPDPAFASNRRIYLSFSERDSADPTRNGTAVARAVLDLQARALSEVTVIYRQLPKSVSDVHYGSRLVFDLSGNLFVTLGERFIERQLAQDLSTGHGKVVRITTDGAPAAGNPVWDTPGAQPHIWSRGHRNPQGAALHPVTGELWISEHGEQGGDEVNRPEAGRNYGWPLATRSQFYGTLQPAGAESLPGMEDPAWVWLQRDGSAWTGGQKSSTAPAGIAFYSADVVPQWKGNLFVTALAGMSLWRLTLEGNRIVAQERLLAERNQRMRDVEQGPDGALYILTDDGKLLRYGP